jgi:glycosyltransferase involved in cell wall biosynthesis
MKILHLYSDWKWTGPAEPVLQMCQSLRQLGHDVLIAYRKPQHEERETIEGKVQEMGLRGTAAFALDRHMHPGSAIRDLWMLSRFLAWEKFDILHVHLCHDHLLGGLCANLLGRKRPVLIRTLHRRDILKPTLGYRFQLKRLTDGCLTFTEKFRQKYMDRFGLDPKRVAVQPMTIDMDCFNPQHNFKDMRSEFGIAAEAPTIGIVGRFQRYRKMEVFLEAARRVLAVEPETRFLVIGRSSKIKETVVEPCHRLGISDKVLLTGYRIDDYVDLLASVDIFSLLMPGFDGTARAVREAMALAKPCVVSDVSMLPEIVRHEEAGLVTPMRPEALAAAWLRLIRNPDERRQMGITARRQAEQRFGIDSVGLCLETFYRKVLAFK